MVKKISFLIISLAILVIGVIGFNKLGYWDRSTRIFNLNSDSPFERRVGRGPGEAGYGRQEQGMRDRNIPDSLTKQFGSADGGNIGHGPSVGGIRNGEGRGRGEFQEGAKINLRNVKWFLSVFAAITVIAIYTDKGICLIRKRKGQKCVSNT